MSYLCVNFVEKFYHSVMISERDKSLREYKFRQWVTKVAEYLTLIELKIKTKDTRGFTDREEELWKVMHKVYENGEFQLYTAENVNIKQEKVTEQGLFEVTELTKLTNGTEIDSTTENE